MCYRDPLQVHDVAALGMTRRKRNKAKLLILLTRLPPHLALSGKSAVGAGVVQSTKLPNTVLFANAALPARIIVAGTVSLALR